MNLLKMNEEQLQHHVQKGYQEMDNTTLFYHWFQSNPTVSKQQTYKQFEEMVGGGDWRSYSIRTSKKSELPDKIQRIYDRTVEACQQSINKFEIELQRRVVERKKSESHQTTSKILYTLLESYLKSHVIPERELGCITSLIDNGTIRTPEQLSEYGIST